MRKHLFGPKPDLFRVFREFTSEELVFLTLHARYGPLVPAAMAATYLGYETESGFRRSVRVGETPIKVFRPPGRLKINFVAARSLAKILIARGRQLPDEPIPEPWSFSADDTAGPEVLILGKALPAARIRTMSLHELTYLRMHARYGPAVTSAKAAQLLWYCSASALMAASHEGRCPIRLKVADGRNKAYASTRAVASLLADIAVTHEGPP